MDTSEKTVEEPQSRGLGGGLLTRHGKPVVAIASLLAVVSMALLFLTMADSQLRTLLVGVVAVLWLFVLNFFRNPQRTIPPGGVVVSPADGTVISVVEVDDDTYVGGPAVRVSIFLSIFNVHVNRVPAAGIVEHLEHRPGTFRSATSADARETNECQEIGIRMADGTPVLLRQIAGLIARRIVCPLEIGQSLEKGFDFGMIRFGSQTEITLPHRNGVPFRTVVSAGQKLKGGESVIGEW